MHDREDPSPQRRRSQLPPLAPRHSHSSSSRDRTSASGSGRPPRLSHRSRAGCWTCRARKVKCDEVHPKCGPCTRLSRECDWDHRWNFSDATTSTQVKYANVTTTGNAVWDPQARSSPSTNPSPRYHDDLPDFAALTTDDDRERKAGTQRPGTFGVVVTPESFYELPEYAECASPSSTRAGSRSRTNSFASQTPFNRLLTRSRTDPNVVVLDRFEDVSSSSGGPLPVPSPVPPPSLPSDMQYLSIQTSLASVGAIFPTSPLSQVMRADGHFLAHFQYYIFSRLVQPQLGTPSNSMVHNPTSNAFELEATRFPPLHHAACAISALNLSYEGRSTMEEALQHYHQALSSQTSVSSPDELLSDGAFLRHFLLFIYDICIPMQNEEGGGDMWAIHLNHLQRIAILRHEALGREPHGNLLWTICELDVHACLLGSGNCDFVRTTLQQNMLPPLEQQIPSTIVSTSGCYLPDEVNILPPILKLNQDILIQTAKFAQTAQAFRREASDRNSISPGLYARWQANVSQLQAEMNSIWARGYPEYLLPESPHAGHKLPYRVRYVFEHALVLYHAAKIYSRTSMFPGQRRIPVASQQEVFADTERRVMTIISVAATNVEARHLDRRYVIFPLFMAGFATTQPDIKIQAIDIIKAYEGTGIGQNTYTTRRLLAAVYEEQRKAADAGHRIEDVDWLAVARRRSLTMVNCGL